MKCVDPFRSEMRGQIFLVLPERILSYFHFSLRDSNPSMALLLLLTFLSIYDSEVHYEKPSLQDFFDSDCHLSDSHGSVTLCMGRPNKARVGCQQ